MGTANEIFYNSYLKKLKRPEFQREYNPNDSYGANSVARSERTNPWAGRDQNNAKFGALGGPSGFKGQPFSLSQGSSSGGVGGSEFSLGDVLSHGKAGINLPMIPSSEKSTFNKLMEPVVSVGGKLGANAIMDWMSTDKFSELSPMMEGFADKALDTIPLSGVGDTMSEMGGGYGGIADMMTKGSTEGLKSAIEGTEAVGDAATDATSSVPYAGTALKLLGDALSGKMFKRPAESIGGVGGALGGAALGSAIFPGVGTAIGALLGGKGGGFLGRTFGRLFR